MWHPILGGGNRIAAYNPYHRLIYIFSIFNVPTNVPADLLALIGCYWIAIDATVRFWHKADTQKAFVSVVAAVNQS